LALPEQHDSSFLAVPATGRLLPVPASRELVWDHLDGKISTARNAGNRAQHISGDPKAFFVACFPACYWGGQPLPDQKSLPGSSCCSSLQATLSPFGLPHSNVHSSTLEGDSWEGEHHFAIIKVHRISKQRC